MSQGHEAAEFEIARLHASCAEKAAALSCCEESRTSLDGEVGEPNAEIVILQRAGAEKDAELADLRPGGRYAWKSKAEAAEARATAAEHERDRMRQDIRYCLGHVYDDLTVEQAMRRIGERLQAAENPPQWSDGFNAGKKTNEILLKAAERKLAAAEQRETEKDKELVGVWGLYDSWRQSPSRADRHAADMLLHYLGSRPALASPSTPSPAPPALP